MLQTQTVQPGVFSLLEHLMLLPDLKRFSLVGGTALSLLYGHRTSVDLDLFSNEAFKHARIISMLQGEFENEFIIEQKPRTFGIFCYIKGVKID